MKFSLCMIHPGVLKWGLWVVVILRLLQKQIFPNKDICRVFKIALSSTFLNCMQHKGNLHVLVLGKTSEFASLMCYISFSGHDRFIVPGCLPTAIMLPDLFICFNLEEIWIELQICVFKTLKLSSVKKRDWKKNCFGQHRSLESFT